MTRSRSSSSSSPHFFVWVCVLLTLFFCRASATTSAACDDGNVCTLDFSDSTLGCQHQPISCSALPSRCTTATTPVGPRSVFSGTTLHNAPRDFIIAVDAPVLALLARHSQWDLRPFFSSLNGFHKFVDGQADRDARFAVVAMDTADMIDGISVKKQRLILDFTSSITSVRTSLHMLLSRATMAAVTDYEVNSARAVVCDDAAHTQWLVSSLDVIMKRCTPTSTSATDGGGTEWTLHTRAWSDKILIVLQPHMDITVAIEGSGAMCATGPPTAPQSTTQVDGLMTGVYTAMVSFVRETGDFIKRNNAVIESPHALWQPHLPPSLSFIVTLPPVMLNNDTFGDQNLWTNVFGSPLHDSHYRDYSHFNQAITLATIIKNGTRAARSLSALLLHRGTTIRVLFDGGWQLHDVQRNIIPPQPALSLANHDFYSSSSGEHADHCDRCHTVIGCDPLQGCLFAKRTCDGAQQICAPYIGCVNTTTTATNAEISVIIPPVAGSASRNDDITAAIIIKEMITTNDTTTATTTEPASSASSSAAIWKHDRVAPFIEAAPSRAAVADDIYTITNLVREHVPVLEWNPDKAFIEEVIARGEPVVIRNSAASIWPAIEKWQNLTYLHELFSRRNTSMMDVKSSTNAEKFYDPDRRTVTNNMADFPTMDRTLPYERSHFDTDDFFAALTASSSSSTDPAHQSSATLAALNWQHHLLVVDDQQQRAPSTTTPSSCSASAAVVNGDVEAAAMVYYFGRSFDHLINDCQPNKLFWRTEQDHQEFAQFSWLSSGGVNMHTHFDQDYNIFVQIVGRKRFTLFDPSESDYLYPFPRIHPMWHKSSVDYKRPILNRFASYSLANARIADIGPGDILYLPPYVWHHVASLDTSVSITSLSHDTFMRYHLDSVYGYDHKFDLLTNGTARCYALRLYIDLLVHKLVGFNATSAFINRLLITRYTGLDAVFPHFVDETAGRVCDPTPSVRIPTARHVYGDAAMDVKLLAPHFTVLPAEHRDILLMDYIEELTAQVVGANRTYAFFAQCFTGQSYRVTTADDDIHAIWN